MIEISGLSKKFGKVEALKGLSLLIGGSTIFAFVGPNGAGKSTTVNIYSIMKHEVESKRDLYDSLFKQLKEAGVLAGLRSTNIVTVDPARPSDRPAKPFVALDLAIALFGGLVVGVAGAFMAENCDDTVTTPDDAEQITMAPALGLIPRWKVRKQLPAPKKLIRPASSCLPKHRLSCCPCRSPKSRKHTAPCGRRFCRRVGGARVTSSWSLAPCRERGKLPRL